MSMTKEQEDVIKRLEKLVELRKNKAEQIKYDNCICATEDLETVLNMLKEKDKRIKELEEENRIYVLNGNNVKLEIYIKDNYIPKQKVKDLIELLEDK